MTRSASVLILSTALAALLTAAAPAMAAPPEGKGKPDHAGGPSKGNGPGNDAMVAPLKKGEASVGDIILDTVLTEVERRLIRDYFAGTDRSSLPPGLAKRDQLPPGLARQVQRNGTLPPGLDPDPLPRDLIDRLPRRGQGIERVVVGSDVILIEQGTRLILDIMENVLSS
ncbi:hypothetical protein [Caenispirillum salinarum]|uniref:hypothetical protein n=1 Tax=Caenispirillum salinarum TaxID=859058 RepID=UPI0038503F51